MKIIKKIASLLGAVALMSALLPVAYAANTPTISAEIANFTNTENETFNVVITLSGMTDLILDESAGIERGMNALQVEVKMPGTYKTDYTGTQFGGNFKPTSTGFDIAPNNLVAGSVDGYLKIAATWNDLGSYNHSSSGVITVPVKLLKKYPDYTNEKLTYANCKVETTNTDLNANTSTDVMYYQTEGKIAFDEVAKLQYNTYVADNATATAVGTTGQFEAGKQLYYVSKILDKASASKKVQLTRIKSDKSEETLTSSSSLADLLGGVAVDGTAISGDVAIGVLTSVTDATYEVKLVD